MSQKSVLIALTIAIALMVSEGTEAKRIGCASFGHSCYGGHGKRSDPTQDIDVAEQPQLSMIRVMQRRFSMPPVDPQLNDISDSERNSPERDTKLMILSVLRDVVDEAFKKLPTKDQDTSV